MAKDKFVEIKVMMEMSYFVPMTSNPDYSKINGWSLDEVIIDWFTRCNINSSHATRDAYLIGGSKKVVSTEIIPHK